MSDNTTIQIDEVTDDDTAALLADAPVTDTSTRLDTFSVCDERTANWVVKKIIAAREYGQRVKIWAAQELARSERDEERLLYFFGAQLEVWATCELQRIKSRRKSISLPAGTVNFRHEPTKLIFTDEEAVLSWAKAHCPRAVQTVERLLKTPINEHFETTGEMPNSGTTLQPERERFYIK